MQAWPKTPHASQRCCRLPAPTLLHCSAASVQTQRSTSVAATTHATTMCTLSTTHHIDLGVLAADALAPIITWFAGARRCNCATSPRCPRSSQAAPEPKTVSSRGVISPHTTRDRGSHCMGAGLWGGIQVLSLAHCCVGELALWAGRELVRQLLWALVTQFELAEVRGIWLAGGAFGCESGCW